MKKLFCSIAIVLTGAIGLAHSASPTLSQHVSTFENYDIGANSAAGTPFYISLPNRTGSGNALVLGISFPFAPGRTVTVTDDRFNNWTLGPKSAAGPSN